jgi:hypothetical protein
MNWNTPMVRPDTLRLELDGGQAWIEVKKRLTHGERSDLLKDFDPARPNATDFRTAVVSAYVVAWSLAMDGKPIPWTPDLAMSKRVATLRSLGTEHFDVIHAAVDRHFADMKEADADEKNGQDGANESSVISPSPDAATGDTRTS